jgi:hypothetical protein
MAAPQLGHSWLLQGLPLSWGMRSPQLVQTQYPPGPGAPWPRPPTVRGPCCPPVPDPSPRGIFRSSFCLVLHFHCWSFSGYSFHRCCGKPTNKGFVAPNCYEHMRIIGALWTFVKLYTQKTLKEKTMGETWNLSHSNNVFFTGTIDGLKQNRQATATDRQLRLLPNYFCIIFIKL